MRRVEMLQEMAQQEVNRQQSGIHSPAVRASIAATLAFLKAESRPPRHTPGPAAGPRDADSPRGRAPPAPHQSAAVAVVLVVGIHSTRFSGGLAGLYGPVLD
jgi:hypothetical protein